MADSSSPSSSAKPTPESEADPVFAVQDRIVYRKNPDEDDMGYKAVLESLTNPQSYLNFRSALRTVIFVSLPLFTLGVHPNTMYKTGFIAMLIAAVLSTSTCRATLGEQIGLHTWTWRGILYMFLVSEAAIALKLEFHPHHWWGLIAAGIFLASFTSDANMRRFMYLYFFLFMMEIREFVLFIPMLPENNGRWLTANFLIGTCLGVAANLLPYPTLLSTIVDTLAAKLFSAVGKSIYMMQKMVWSDDPHAAMLFFNDKSIFESVEHWLGLMPTLLWFTNWEPLEFALRNPVRRLKFSFLRRILSLVYAAFSAGTSLVKLKKDQMDRIALQKVRHAMWQKAFGIQMIGANPNSPCLPPSLQQRQQQQGGQASFSSESAGDVHFYNTLVRQYGEEKANEIFDEMWTLHQNSKSHSANLAVAVMHAVTAIATAPCTPDGLLEKVDFDGVRVADREMRRNLRLEVVQSMHRQRELIMKRRKDQETSTPVFASPTSSASVEALIQYQRLIDDSEVYIRLNTIFFHMLLSMIAGEVFSFGEQMKDYKPEKSLCQRLLDHFIIEPWFDFWEEVWCHLTLARPADWRILKDAIKVTCAYLSACALNFQTYTMPGGMYYFGTTILLGLPVEEESLSLAVNRLAGNALGCSLGFLAYNNFSGLHQIIPMTLFFMFLCQLFKNHPVYGQTFFYGSIMVIGGVATSLVPIDLLTRLIFSSYTICAYLLCCLLIFPTNPTKILWGYRAKLNKLISEIVDQAALTAHCSLEEAEKNNAARQGGGGGIDHSTLDNSADAVQRLGHYPFGNEEAAEEPPTYPLGSDAVMISPQRRSSVMVAYGRSGQLCSELSAQIGLARRLFSMCTKWTPFAARQHVIRGMLPFPEVASRQVHQSQGRLLAELDLLVFGAQLLHRPRDGKPISKPLARLISGSLSDFLFDFSHACRSVLQDMIDSTQWSRKWDYELFLRRCARLSRLKVAARAVMYECYVLLGDSASSNTEGTFDDAAFEMLRSELREAQHSSGVLGPHTSSLPPPQHPFPADSVADQILLIRAQGRDVRSPPTAHPAGSDGQQQQSVEMHNKSFHFTAPLVKFSMNPNAASRFQSKDTEETRVDTELAQRSASNSFLLTPSGGGGAASPHSTASATLLPGDDPQSITTNPLYETPANRNPQATWLNFSYHEDATDLPTDTDFLAVSAILGSCEGFITEVESMCGPVNTISSYHKQLHESSLALPLIDKISKKMRSHVEKVYLTRHYNLPIDDLNQGGAHYIQTDMYRAWAF